MDESAAIHILPYTSIVGQEQLKLALELSYIAPRIGGVLISGQRGTGKSTAVRAFAQMIYGHLPVTLPINATEDRVVGGWKIDELMRGEAIEQPGLLQEAHGRLLYVDEVNLLDDHIVNVILDVTSTGVLVVQREGRRDQKAVSFTLVGTMNPEEGGLRPQLLDRFGLMSNVTAETNPLQRQKILQTVLAFDEALFRLQQGQPALFIENAQKQDQQYKTQLDQARKRFYEVEVSEEITRHCVVVATEFQAEGHRGDFLLVLAARAYAAREGVQQVNTGHVKAVGPLALQHRRPEVVQGGRRPWTQEDDQRVAELLDHA